ncbi:MAG: carboxymuconolactone decarboxylase family protein [Actinomycetales bacterium]|nr:carboxymuconolactone decarboxylase family protein [Actinomycetales bacterium]
MTDAFIAPPRRIPLILRVGLWITRRRTGDDPLIARLLAWDPRTAVGTGLMEALVVHARGRADERVLKLVRMTVSAEVDCPFCIGFNGRDWEKLLTEDELAVVQGRVAPDTVATLTAAERLAIEFARAQCQTPLAIDPTFGPRLREHFSEREIVVLASTAAQVNHWARLVQGLGCPPMG